MKIKNPKLSVTVNEGAYISGCYLDSSNFVHYGEKNESTEFISVKVNDGVFIGASYQTEYIIVSDTVNCTADDGNILITDPTKDASCSINEYISG